MKSTVNRIALALMLGFVVTVAAQAQFSWQSYTDPAVPGHVVNDLYVDFAGNVPIVEMLLNAPGNIFQDAVGDPTGAPPLANLVGNPAFPMLAFDSFVTLGGETSPLDGTALLIAGGAVDIGGAPTATFSDSLLDITWSPAGGQTFANPNPGVGGFMARVTLVDTSQDTVTLFLQDANGSSDAFMFTAEGGAFGVIIPEPSSMAMLVLGLLGFLRRRV